ncbi:uncharacterized protein [Mobula birostris]|uniref:uncharacterized protein n=1 Tax=Mobula birostris TaxID=1983395 RepID=UPI003B27D560
MRREPGALECNGYSAEQDPDTASGAHHRSTDPSLTARFCRGIELPAGGGGGGGGGYFRGRSPGWKAQGPEGKGRPSSRRCERPLGGLARRWRGREGDVTPPGLGAIFHNRWGLSFIHEQGGKGARSPHLVHGHSWRGADDGALAHYFSTEWDRIWERHKQDPSAVVLYEESLDAAPVAD